jgi:hypothetical protein
LGAISIGLSERSLDHSLGKGLVERFSRKESPIQKRTQNGSENFLRFVILRDLAAFLAALDD